MTTGGVPTELQLPIRPDASLLPSGGISLGSDGNLWFAERRSTLTSTSNPRIARLTPQGDLTEFVACGEPLDVTPGPDGSLWFGAYINAELPHGVGRISVTGEMALFGVALSQPHAITAGPDGAIWFVDAGGVKRLVP